MRGLTVAHSLAWASTCAAVLFVVCGTNTHSQPRPCAHTCAVCCACSVVTHTTVSSLCAVCTPSTNTHSQPRTSRAQTDVSVQADADVHKATARRLFSLGPGAPVPDEQRQIAKVGVTCMLCCAECAVL